MRGSAFTMLASLVIILNNAQQLFDFLGAAQPSVLTARLHRPWTRRHEFHIFSAHRREFLRS